MFGFNLDHDMYVLVYNGPSIGIKEDSPFWEYPPEKKESVLQEARGKMKYAYDLAVIERYEHCGRSDDLESIREMIEAFQRIKENPFADDRLKKVCPGYLSKFYADVAYKSVNRGSNNGLRRKVYRRDSGKCRYCGESVSAKAPLDHVVPYGLGGKTDYENLVVSCNRCNSKKNCRTPEQAGMKLIPLE